MATLQTVSTVSKGQSDWQENVNQTIQAVNSLVGGTEPTHLTNVFTYVNGVTGSGGEAWYWSIGDYKLVYLWTGSFTTPQGFVHDSEGMTVPDTIAPIHETNILTSRDNTLMNGYGNSNTNTFHIFPTNAADGETSGIGSVLYLANA